MMVIADVRKAKRYGLSLPVEIHAISREQSAPLIGRTRDISAQGVFFVVDAEFHPGGEVDLTMTVPSEFSVGGCDSLIRVTGRVVRVENSPRETGRGIGVAATIERYEITRRNKEISNPD